MELQYFGANSVKVTTKKSTISVDPVSDIAKLSTDLKKTNTVIVTKPEFAESVSDDLFIIDCPGEYEFEDYSVRGIAAQSSTESTGGLSSTMYKLTTADISVLFVGHIESKLSEDQLESIGIVDVVVIPVGGGGYTLDATSATSVVRAVEPKVVIPVHSVADKLSYSVPQDDLEAFTKELGAPVADEIVEKYKIKSLPEQLTVQLLSKS